MLVSNFNVGYNPSSWPGGHRSAAGYALQITNLERKRIEFGVECRITHLVGHMPGESDLAFLKTLFGNKTWQKDARGIYAFDRWGIDANDVGEWRLAMVGGRVMWPWWDWAERRIFLVLGYVSLRVPASRSVRYPYPLEPQSDHPVQVLLSAWREDQWLVAGSGSDQMQSSSLSSIQLASGRALYEIPPEGIPYFSELSVSEYLTLAATGAGAEKAKGAMDVPEEDRAQALIDLLGALAHDQREIDALNRILQDLKVPLSVRATRGEEG